MTAGPGESGTLRRRAPAVAVHALAVVHAVADPERTAALLVRALGFHLVERGPRRSVQVNNGAVSIRLVRTPDWADGADPRGDGAGEPGPLELEVETEDLTGAFESLRCAAEIVRVGAERRVGGDRMVRRIELQDQVVVRLTRVLTEDDLGFLPPLPATLVWHEESDRVVRRVLRAVPLAFREAARERVTRRAEAAALEAGRVEVGMESAVRGLIEATPEFEHASLRRALRDEGIDVDRLLEDP